MAENWQAYTKTDWAPGMPITEAKMDHLEEGVESNRDDAIALKNSINTINTTIGNTYNTENTVADAISGLQSQVNEKINTVDVQSLIEQGSGQGAWAKTEILDATTNEALQYKGPYDSLRERFRLDETLIENIRKALGQTTNQETGVTTDIYSASATVASAIASIYNSTELILQEVRAARVDDIASPSVAYDSLYLHLRHIDDELDKVRSGVSTILASTGTDENDQPISLTARFAQLQNLIEEVEAAHRAVEEGQAPDTLLKRFQAIESRINTIETDSTLADQISAINTEISDAHLFNNNVEGTLDSRFDAIDGGSAPTRTLPSIITEVNAGRGSYDTLNARFNADETNINHKVDKDNIYNDLDYVPTQDLAITEHKVLDAAQGKALKDLIDDLDTDYQAADRAIDTRLVSVEDELDDARIQIGTDEDTQEPIMSTLDQRLNSMDTTTAGIRADVNTIADELNMYTAATHTIAGQNSRIDQMEANLVTMANEIGMLQNGEEVQDMASAISDQGTRIDTIDTEISNAHRTGLVDDQDQPIVDTLDNRFDNIETAISGQGGLNERMTAAETVTAMVTNQTTGLAATKAIADANAAAISHEVGENGNEDKGGLLERIQALETTPTSATVIINKERIIYNNEGVPTVYTANYVESGNNTPIQPTEKVDYLFETQVGDEIKYFYWKYINNQWEKISGGEGGGSGNGNNNAQVYANYAAFLDAAKDLNKDYYVLQNGIYHHYRYESVDPQAEPIEIGIVIDTTNIKTYNMNYRADTANNKNYLDLYQFDYGVSNTNLDDTLPGVTVFSVELPEGIGGGGSVLGNNVCKVIQVGQNANSTISQEEAKSVILSIFYQAYEADEDQRTWSNASYTLYKNDMIIDSNTFKGNNAALNINPDDEWSHVVDGETVVETQKDNPAYWVNFDVTQYCDVNVTNRFKLVVNSDNGLQRTRNWEIEIISLTIDTRDFDSNLLYDADTNLNIGLTMIGAKGERRIEAIVDGQTSNRIIKNTNETASSITIPAANLNVGAHKIDIRFSQYIGENTDPSYSNTLSLDIMCRDQNNDDQIILSSKYRNVYPNQADIEDEQYAMIEIPYNLYVPNNQEVTISYTNTLNNQTTTEELTTGIQYYRFKASGYNEAGTLTTATISCVVDNEVVASISIKLFIKKSEYEIVSTTDSLVFDFNPEGYTNSTTTIAERLWKDKNNSNISLSTNNTFDWIHGGWGYDDTEKAPYFCIKAGSRATINYSLFDQITQGNLDDSGANFKCIFKVANVSQPEAVFLTSIDETPSTIVNYGSDKLNTKQSLEELKEDTLFSKYLNVVEYRIIPYDTKKGKLKTDDTIVAFCVLPNGNGISISEDTINSLKAAAEQKAFNSNIQMSYDNIHSLLYIPQSQDEDDENAYDATIEQRQALNALITDDKLTSISEVTNIMNTLSESSDWAEYRETRSYGLLNGYLDNLVKKVLIIDYTHWDVVTTNNFESQEFINSTQFPSQTNEINHKETRNIRVTPTDVTAGQPTVQIDIEYTDVSTPTQEDPNHKTRVYGQILAIRTIDSVLTQGRGLELRAHRSNLYLNNGTLTYPYAEEDIIEYEYNIHVLNPQTEGQRYTSYILAYEDGVPSASILYPVRTNALKQQNPGQLILGSDDCDVYIYRMKFYGKELSNKDILQNFCADAVNSEKAIDRYRNNIKTYTSPETDTVQADPDMISPISIAKACPDLRVIMIEAPSFTTSKNNYVKNTTIRCIKTGIEEGRDAKEDNWIAYNAYHAGQGTSSDAYGAAGRNIDIIFAFNGNEEVVPPKAKNTYRFDKNYKSVVVKGVPIEQGNGSIQSYETYLNTIVNQRGIRREEDPDAYEAFISQNHMEGTTLTIDQNGTGKISLSESSVPNNWFNIKLNIASSENTNNALLQKRYDRYLKEIIYKNTAYKNLIPAMNRDPYVKNDMEFFNTIVFIRETDPSITNGKYTKHSEFNDTDWHFYGIGNLGDSKKTDSTRANIPNDPYEFCVEISDNGLTNSGFASGVWYSGEDENHNGTGAQFTASNYGIKYPISLEEWNSENNGIRQELQNYNTEDEGWQHSFEFRYDPNTKDGSIVTTDPAEKAAIELFQVHNREIFANMYEWVVTAPTSGSDSFINTLGTWFLEPSPLYWYLFTERYTMIDSRAKNTFYHYGKIFISDDEYNIITKEKDGTSYETTQAIFDHETNITNLQAQLVPITAQIASLKEQIAALDKATQQEDINALNAQLAPIQAQSDEINWNIQQEKAKKQNSEYIMQHRDWFTHDNAEAQYHDGYRFDMWDYDNDTALGINNNGKMVFEAGIEDVDKINDVWVYNEATSVFWCRIRDEGYDKLVSLYAQLKDECFNAEHLIGEFDKWQSEFPENLWRMDFERKYRRPYENGGEVTYLRDMANGRKKYQRREFERNMSVYIHSKYDRMSPYSASDELSFRPVDRGYQINDMSSPGDIGESKIMSIMPYSKIYINMMVGNSADSKIIHERANPGIAYKYNVKEVISSLNGQLQNIQCRVFNASRIQELNGLEHYYADDLKVAAAKKLKKITVGTDYVLNSNNEYILDNNNNPIPYINDKTTTIVLGTSDDANPILETLDIRNCVNLTPTFSLQGCINLKNLYAYGTPITKFDFADNGLLTNLYLPTTIQNLTFENLHLLNKITTRTFEQEQNGEGVDTYNNLTTYISHNSSDAANSQYILTNAFNKLTTIDLDNINWELASLPNFEIFDQKKKVLEATDLQGKSLGSFILAGTINILGSWSTIAKENYSRNWNYKIIFNTISERETFQTQVNFYDSSYESDTGLVPAKLLNTIFVDANNIIADPYTTSTPITSLPQRNPTKEKTFQFGSLTQSNQYRPYSGWSRYSDCSRLEDTLYGEGRRMTEEEALRASNTTSESINLYSYYSSTPHLYEVQWILDRDHPETIVTPSTNIPQQGYGEGEDLSAPTIADIRKQYSTFEITPVENMTDTYDIRIFKQWEKLPTNIDPSSDEAITNKYTIYGQWETTRVSINNNDENNLFNNINTLNENQLLLLSYLNSKEKSDHNILPTTITQKQYKYRMGYDGRPNTGILLADSNSNVTPIYTFNEDTDSILVQNNGRYITPFANNNGFTLVIDYTFDQRSNPGSASVLVGCYEKDTNDTATTGFALYNVVDSSLGNTGITIGYGDMFNYRTGTSDSQTIRIGSSNIYKRNIVVIRHPKNSSKLIIYSSKSSNGFDDTDSTIISSTLSLSTQVLNANARLCFGGLRKAAQNESSSLYANENAQLTRAYGTIYWAKYWDEDLGDGECKELAAWPHEDITAIVADMSNNNTSGNRPSIYLTTLNSSTHYNFSPAKIANMPDINNQDTVTGGWNLSEVATLFDGRIFQALPHKLQAIINKTGIGSKNYEAVWGRDPLTLEPGVTFRTTGAISKNMYLYAPSVSSLIPADGSRFSDYNDESILERNGTTSGSITTLTPYAWITGAEGLMNVYEYNNNSWNLSSANYEYLNLRFPYKPINISASNKMRIFKLNIYNVNNTTFRNLINIMNPQLTEGDIVIYQSSSSEINAYMYINANSLSQLGIKVEPSEAPSIFNVGTQGGGWIKSTRYITRSMLPAQSQTNFIYVKENGEFGEAATTGTQPTNVNLNYSFTI